MFTLYVRPQYRDAVQEVVADLLDWCADVYPGPTLSRNNSRIDCPRIPEVVGRLRSSLRDAGLTTLAASVRRS